MRAAVQENDHVDIWSSDGAKTDTYGFALNSAMKHFFTQQGAKDRYKVQSAKSGYMRSEANRRNKS